MRKLTFMQKATIENAALRNGATDEQIEEKIRLATERLNAPKKRSSVPNDSDCDYERTDGCFIGRDKS